MQEVAFIERLEAATALFHPMRLELIRRLAEPGTCTELGRAIGETPQKVNYHVKVLVDQGLVERVDERRVRGIMEGIFQARAQSYWLSPDLVGRIGKARDSGDRLSLGFLLDLSDQLRGDIHDLVRASTTGQRVPTLGLSVQVELRDGSERQAFLRDVQAAIQGVAEKYGRRAADPEARAEASERGEVFRVALACYPKPSESVASSESSAHSTQREEPS